MATPPPGPMANGPKLLINIGIDQKDEVEEVSLSECMHYYLFLYFRFESTTGTFTSMTRCATDGWQILTSMPTFHACDPTPNPSAFKSCDRLQSDSISM